MTDHADTIRRTREEMTEYLLIDPCDPEQTCSCSHDCDERILWLIAERQQAIDALRRIELWPFNVMSSATADLLAVREFAREALGKLGEQP